MRSMLASALLGLLTLALCAVPLFGQATFTAASSVNVGADIGVTELTGAITLIVSSGTTLPTPFSIQYSAAITNDTASGITVTGTGGLAGASVSVNQSSSQIILNVPGGGATGSTITLGGVRVALAGQDYKNVTATINSLTSPGNAIIAGQNTVTVINSIQQPFSITFGSNNLTESILVKENYVNAFTSSVGVLGQTVPSRLRINPFPAIPQNVTLSFPRTVTAPEDGASFTTASGTDETVPRKDGSTTADYIYTGPAVPSVLPESFKFNVTAMVQLPTPGGTISFQATLLPIGGAVPDSQFPSTDIPRYAERAVPDATDLITGFSQLTLPFLDASSAIYTGVAITNPIPFPIKLTLTAYDLNGSAIAGPDVTNPVTITMPKGGQLAKIANEIFGQNFNASGPGTIVATGKTPSLAGFYLQGRLAGQGLDGTTALAGPAQNWVFPSIFRGGASAFTSFQMFNPGTGTATATLRLVDSSGKVVAVSSPTTIPAGGTMLRELKDLFPGVNLNSFPGGYITGDSDTGLVTSENYGDVLDFNILQGQKMISRQSFQIPHFASGGGYTTEINLINVEEDHTAVITLTAFDNSGARIGVAENPVKLTMAPGVQVINTIDRLFPSLPSSLTTGYIELDVEVLRIIPFGYFPTFVGSVRFSATDGSGSAALPLLMPSSEDFVYAHVAQDLGFYTGVTLLNANDVPASVKLQVLREDGSVVGSFTTTLQPGQKISNLLFELVPASAGQVGGYVRVQSDQYISSFALFGTTDLKTLSAIPPQNVAQ